VDIEQCTKPGDNKNEPGLDYCFKIGGLTFNSLKDVSLSLSKAVYNLKSGLFLKVATLREQSGFDKLNLTTSIKVNLQTDILPFFK